MFDRWRTGGPSAVSRAFAMGIRLANQPGDRGVIARATLSAARLHVVNIFSRQRVTQDSGIDVAMTTFGARAKVAHIALESIARGSTRPRKLILWVDDERILADLPRGLKRLQRRGLEILQCSDYGPHKKQYPYVTQIFDGTTSLATADDDAIYPKTWLTELAEALLRMPNVVHGHRAYLMSLADEKVADYSSWALASSCEPSIQIFCTGVSGVAYPPSALRALKEEGDRFMQLAPRADDVWVHSVLVRAGIESRQVADRPLELPTIPFSQAGALYKTNVFMDENDKQIGSCYGPGELAALSGAINGRLSGASRSHLGDSPGAVERSAL